MSKELVIINDGEIQPLSEGRIPVTDRSFLFGDSIYEVIITHKGQPFFTDDHLDRLYLSAKGIFMEMPWDKAFFKQQIRRGLNEYSEDIIYVRIVVSRGIGEVNIDLSKSHSPMAVFIFRALEPYADEMYDKGLKLSVPTRRRNHPDTTTPEYKTGNYLNNIQCLAEAKNKGAHDALILSIDGNVTESTVSNFFIVTNGEVWTPPTSVGILHGITRKYIINIAWELGYTVVEKNFTMDAVKEADEAFLSSTTKGAMPVYQIDDLLIRETCGPVTKALNEAYWEYVANHIDTDY